LKFIDWPAYQEFYDSQEKTQKDKKQKKTPRQGGGNFWMNLFNRNSYTFTSTIVSAAIGGRILYRDAADLLNVKVTTIAKIAEKLGQA
jgi:hypothetical protein